MKEPKSMAPDMPTVAGQTQDNLSSTKSVNRDERDDFRPGTRLWLVFMTLSVVALMVSLDGSSISVALPVSTSV